MKKTTIVYITSDGKCPICGKLVEGNKPETHHTHKIFKADARRLKLKCASVG